MNINGCSRYQQNQQRKDKNDERNPRPNLTSSRGAYLGSEVLTRACYDESHYALKLRTGEVLRFTAAKLLNREWIHLFNNDTDLAPQLPLAADGIDVRVSEIVWAMDVAEGQNETN